MNRSKQIDSISLVGQKSQTKNQQNVLDLFSGSGSCTKAAKKLGHQVFSSDINEKLENIDYCVDILQFDPQRVPFVPTFIWASPNCATYSIAANKTHREKSN